MIELYESTDVNVSHPKHYQSKSGLEVIDVIEAFTEDLDGIYAVDTANILKYACRWKHKNGKQDVAKIIWYSTHLLRCLEKQEQPITVKKNDGFEANTAEYLPKTLKFENTHRDEVWASSTVGANPDLSTVTTSGLKYTE